MSDAVNGEGLIRRVMKMGTISRRVGVVMTENADEKTPRAAIEVDTIELAEKIMKLGIDAMSGDDVSALYADLMTWPSQRVEKMLDAECGQKMTSLLRIAFQHQRDVFQQLEAELPDDVNPIMRIMFDDSCKHAMRAQLDTFTSLRAAARTVLHTATDDEQRVRVVECAKAVTAGCGELMIARSQTIADRKDTQVKDQFAAGYTLMQEMWEECVEICKDIESEAERYVNAMVMLGGEITGMMMLEDIRARTMPDFDQPIYPETGSEQPKAEAEPAKAIQDSRDGKTEPCDSADCACNGTNGPGFVDHSPAGSPDPANTCSPDMETTPPNIVDSSTPGGVPHSG